MLGITRLGIAVIKILRTLMERVASMQEQIGKESRDMETLRNNPKGMPEIKNIITNAECLWWAHQYIGHD